MNQLWDEVTLEGVRLVQMQSDHLSVDVAPGVGGRVVSLRHKPTGQELLWRNSALTLERLPAFSEYDPNFYGGIDELIPNDVPERLDDHDEPDHGELWTTPLEYHVEGRELVLNGRLPVCGLVYERRIRPAEDEPRLELHYRIHNPTDRLQQFMWKLHPALAIAPGDVIECPAGKGRVPDLQWSCRKTSEPFDWPVIQGERADLIPPKNGTLDFFYLYDLRRGEISLNRPSVGLRLTFSFDTSVFPYAWIFASYGGFRDHYVVILEPCSTMHLSVNEAIQAGRCSRLRPGQTLETMIAVNVAPASRR